MFWSTDHSIRHHRKPLVIMLERFNQGKSIGKSMLKTAHDVQMRGTKNSQFNGQQLDKIISTNTNFHLLRQMPAHDVLDRIVALRSSLNQQTLATGRPTMSLPAAVKNVGANVALRQAEGVYMYQLPRQSSEQTKLAFSNRTIWVKTFNPSVTSENAKDGEVFRLSFRYQQNKGVQSQRKRSSKRYATRQAAEEAMFDVRVSFESKGTKEALLAVLEGEADLEPMPKKRSSADSSPAPETKQKKRRTMRYDHAARSSSVPNCNPSGPGDIDANSLAAAIGDVDDLKDIATVLNKRYRHWLEKEARDADKKVLESALEKDEWWKLMPFGEDVEVQADATDTDKKKLLCQAKCVLKALNLYGGEHDENGNVSYTWREACADAVESLMEKFNGQTVERWYIKFRCKSGEEDQERRFPLSQTGKKSNGTVCPFTLPSKRHDGDDNEDADDEGLVGHEYQKEILEFRHWFDENQSIMSVEKARMWYETKIAELMAIDSSFMATYRIKSIAPLSVYVAKCWMRKMGVEYCRQSKNYYVKRHESEKAKGQRVVYIPWSFGIELRELCWVQLTEEQIIEIASKVDTSDDDDDGTATAAAAAAATGSGRSAPTTAVTRDAIVKHMKDNATRTGRIEGEKVWEFHADDFVELHEIANREEFGGKKSIAFPEDEKVAMIHGHDESIYSQNNQTFSGYVRDDQTLLRTKGNGFNQVASATCSRSCGWGMRHYLSTLSEEQLEEARDHCNRLHRQGKQYHPLIQEWSADLLKSRNGGVDKKEFSKEEFTVTINPAVRYLNAGNGPGREGNWNLAHFLIQFEDFRDFLFALFPDPNNETQCEFDQYIEVDQSTSHCAALPEALNPGNMNHSWVPHGGPRRIIRDSVIPDPILPDTKYTGDFVPTIDGPDGTKVEHPKRVRPGDTVVYQFVQGDPMPFNPGKEAPPEQDEPIPGKFLKNRKYTKEQLWNMILENSPLQNMPGKDAKEASLVALQNLAQQAGLPIKREGPLRIRRQGPRHDRVLISPRVHRSRHQKGTIEGRMRRDSRKSYRLQDGAHSHANYRQGHWFGGCHDPHLPL